MASHLPRGRRCLLNRTRVCMRTSNRDPLDTRLEWRLKASLDRITPPWSRPRYQSAASAIRPMRLAPVLLAGSLTVLMALTATATTGSPNPAVWTQRAASTIESVGRASGAAPKPEPSPERVPTNPRSVPPAATATHATSQKAQPEPESEAAPGPEPAEPVESPEPSHTRLPGADQPPGSSSTRPSPSPEPSESPTPEHH